MLKLQVHEKEVEIITSEEFVRGTVGKTCQINLDEFWADYSNTIVFKRCGSKPINILIDKLSNTLTIPFEVMAESGVFRIGVFGVAEDKVLPTLWSNEIKVRYGTDTFGTAPSEYTPDEIEQLKTTKQDKLTAGDNITIDGNNVISAIVPEITIDNELSATSENAVQNKVVTKALSDNKKYIDTGLSKKLDETSSILYTNKIAFIPSGATSSDVFTNLFLDMYNEPHIIIGTDENHPYIRIPATDSNSPIRLYKDIVIGSIPLMTTVDVNGRGTIKLGNPSYPVKIYNVETDTTDDSSVVNYGQLKDSIATQVSSVYKAKGSIADISALPTPDEAHEGFVYNIESEFTTNSNFVEGVGKTYPAGTNVVIVSTTGTEYKYDVLAGMVDLSNYATKTELSGKLDKVTSTGSYRAYIVAADGSQGTMVISSNTPSGNTIANRTSTGTLKCATPTANDDAATKKYIDDAIGNINSILATMFNDVSTQSDEEPTDEEVIA